MNDQRNTPKTAQEETETSEKPQKKPLSAKEFGGREGPEPTRFGDWENNGIASDF